MASTIVKSLRISPDIWKQVESVAEELETSPNQFVVAAIVTVMAQRDGKDVVVVPHNAAKSTPFKTRLKGEWKAP